tara:strand:- start:2949 stop:4859 length:1911 start_codon:yes stop_codon:yes gene_type:complete
MCGISGFIKFKNNLSVDILKKYSLLMANTLEKRGPDQLGYWCDETSGIALSHRRLSIIDLSTKANQPMVSFNKRYIIVFNGEIYNFKIIRSYLKEKIQFKTNSDTEVLLELISSVGPKKAIYLLNGIFAFAVWDKKKRKLFVCRDRVGVKPVYTYYDGVNFAFASELKALKKLPWINLELDKKSISSYVRLNYIPSPYSIFKNVSKLSPGSFLEIDLKKSLKKKKYWKILDILEKKNFASSNDTLHIIENAVKNQMVSDVPVGVFLSGGVDSSLIAALAQKNSKKSINSFTIGFKDDQFNEARFAKKVSRILGTNHNEVFFNFKNLADLIDLIPIVYDEPFADSSQLPTLLLSQITKKKVTVALSGDGGDEMFAGYYRYFLVEKYQKYIFKQPLLLKLLLRKIINFIPKKLWDNLGTLLPNNYGGKQFGDKLLKLSSLLTNKDETSFQQRIISNCNDLSDLLYEKEEKKVDYFDKKYETLFKDTTFRMQVLDFLIYLPDDILTKVDRASMNNSLEVRVPFLDNNVIEHAFSLEKKNKIKGSEGKIILKKVLKNFLPDSLINRPKMGFGIPLDNLIRENFSDKIEYYLNSKIVRDQNIYNLEYFNILWSEHKDKKRNWQFLLWNFLVFQMWFEHWEA